MRITVAPMMATFLSILLLVPFAILFAYYLDFGIYGLGLANVISTLVPILLLQVYMAVKKEIKEGVFWPRADSL